jgi:hypothetical protein
MSSPAHSRYYNHKSRCRGRGQVWNLTFEQWRDWWLAQGYDKTYPFTSTQPRAAGPCRGAMARIDPAQPWQLNNIAVRDNPDHNKNPPGLAQANPRSRRCCTPAGVFVSLSAAGRHYGITTGSMWNRLQDHPDQYYYES